MRNLLATRRRMGLVAAGALAFGLAGLGAFPAAAQNTDVFSCRASAVRVVAGQFESEPVRANEQSAPCSTQRSEVFGPQNVTAPPPFSAAADANAAGAYTSRASNGVGALAGLGSASGRVDTGTVFGTQTASFSSAQTSVTWRCAGGTAVVTTSSEIADLQINGTPAPVPSGPQTIPLPGGATLYLNRVVRVGDIVTVRAVELTHPDAGSVVLAESVAGFAGSAAAACQDLAGTPSESTVRPCASGSTFDPNSGNCVITVAGQTIVVSKPFEGPEGGSVITLGQARQRYPNSPCVKGEGPNLVIVGTNGNDDITGTTRADRILLLAGSRDEAEGGTGGDCIDGGRGRDVISGAVGNDRLYGGAGNDALVGGSHVDRLSGGSGADTLNTGYGRDSAYGGDGRDRINAATGGPPVKVISCGKGRDNVRINRNEKRRVRRDCERVQVLQDRA